MDCQGRGRVMVAARVWARLAGWHWDRARIWARVQGTVCGRGTLSLRSPSTERSASPTPTRPIASLTPADGAHAREPAHAYHPTPPRIVRLRPRQHRFSRRLVLSFPPTPSTEHVVRVRVSMFDGASFPVGADIERSFSVAIR